MRKQLTIGFFISLCLLSGCTKDNQTIGGTNTNKEHITREVFDANEDIIANIDADIIYPDTKNIPVATLKQYEFTNDDIKRIANAIYGDSEYYKLLQPNEYSVNQLNEAIMESEATLDELGYYIDNKINASYSGSRLVIEYEERPSTSVQLYDENKIDQDYFNFKLFECADQIYKFNQLLTNASDKVDNSPVLEFYDVTVDTWGPVNNNGTNEYKIVSSEPVQQCNLQGTYKDMPCSIKFSDKLSLSIEMNAADTPVWKDYTYKEINIETSHDNHYTTDNPDIENECKLSIDQAIYMCNSIIEEFGISNMEVMVIYNLPVKAYNISPEGHRYNGHIDKGYCGYEIYYGKSINSVSSNAAAYDNYYMDYGMGAPENLIFTVMDCGIISISYTNPTIVEDISTDNTTILDFDEVLNLSDIYLPYIYSNAKINNAYTSPFKITKIQLGLGRVVNLSDSSDFSLIPVWNFYEDGNPDPLLTINAIDGSSINNYTGCVIE